MDAHLQPCIREFFLVFWKYWGARVSGIFAVPFAIASLAFSGIARWIFVALSISAFLFTAYLIWADERRRLVALEQHLVPRLRIEFEPLSAKFLHGISLNAPPVAMLYIRVIVRALSPVAHDCRVYLTRISRWDGERYVPMFDEQMPMPWCMKIHKHPVPKN